MADELRSFRSGALCSQPTSCFASCCNEPLDRRASRCSAMGEEYSQKNANERYHQCADNFAPTPVARVLPQEPGGATQEQQSQGCPVLRASFPTRTALG